MQSGSKPCFIMMVFCILLATHSILFLSWFHCDARVGFYASWTAASPKCIQETLAHYCIALLCLQGILQLLKKVFFVRRVACSKTKNAFRQFYQVFAPSNIQADNLRLKSLYVSNICPVKLTLHYKEIVSFYTRKCARLNICPLVKMQQPCTVLFTSFSLPVKLFPYVRGKLLSPCLLL